MTFFAVDRGDGVYERVTFVKSEEEDDLDCVCSGVMYRKLGHGDEDESAEELFCTLDLCLCKFVKI